MFSSSDDEQLGLVLGVLGAIVGLVVTLVLSVAASRLPAAPLPATAAVPAGALPARAPIPVAPAPVVLAPTAATDTATALSAQNASDAASITVEYGVVKFYFASGKAELAPGAKEALVDVVRGARSGKKVVISGFHDATGPAGLNAGLARQRGQTVKEALKELGVPETQLLLQAPALAAGSGSDAEARRVEISLQ
jgi:K(+)-stimulated pyrophosphate-energized sodium pump